MPDRRILPWPEEGERRAGRRPVEPGGSEQPPDPSWSTVSPPDDVVQRAKAAFSLRAPGEVATLVFDSLVDEGAPAGNHEMRFEHPLLQADLHLSASSSGTTLSGRVRPTLAGRVELEFEGSEASIVERVVDGVLRFGPVPHGLIRLWLTEMPQRPAIHTDWFRV